MSINTMSRTRHVDALLKNPQNRALLVAAFSDWIELRAAAPAEEAEILRSPLASEDRENGLTIQSLAEDVRLEAARRAPWSDGDQEDAAAVDSALACWAKRVLPSNTDNSTVPSIVQTT